MVARNVLGALRSSPGGARLLDAMAHAPSPPAALVGGAVRDLLLGRPPRELDVVVEGPLDPLAAALGGTRVDHERFGTATVTVDGDTYDLARARTETYAAPGALPDVSPATLVADLRRRDVTVNAIALRPDGDVVAVDGALQDLEAGRLRVLHDASFRDDPTRLWRVARYAARLGFQVEPHTAALAADAVAAGALDTVSAPRIGAELRLALGEPSPNAALGRAAAMGLLPAGFAAPGPEAECAAALLPADGRPDLLLLAAWARGDRGAQGADGAGPGVVGGAHGVGGAGRAGGGDGRVPGGDGAALRAWLDALAFPAEDRDVVLAAATAPDRLVVAGRPSALAAVLRREPVEAVALAGAVHDVEAARRWIDELRHVRLDIGGDDLLAAGVPAGPEIGARLAAALAARLDGAAPDRTAQLAAALGASP